MIDDDRRLTPSEPEPPWWAVVAVLATIAWLLWLFTEVILAVVSS